MSDFISLHCPSCGNLVQFLSSAENLFCTHCGIQLLYQNGGLIVVQADSGTVKKVTGDTRQIEEEITNTMAEIAKIAKKMDPILIMGLILLILAILGILSTLAISNNIDLSNMFCILGVITLLGFLLTLVGGIRSSIKRKRMQKVLKKRLADLEAARQAILNKEGETTDSDVSAASQDGKASGGTASKSPTGIRTLPVRKLKKPVSGQTLAAIVILSTILSLGLVYVFVYYLLPDLQGSGGDWNGTYQITSVKDHGCTGAGGWFPNELKGKTQTVADNKVYDFDGYSGSIDSGGHAKISTGNSQSDRGLEIYSFSRNSAGVSQYSEEYTWDGGGYCGNNTVLGGCMNPLPVHCTATFIGTRISQ